MLLGRQRWRLPLHSACRTGRHKKTTKLQPSTCSCTFLTPHCCQRELHTWSLQVASLLSQTDFPSVSVTASLTFSLHPSLLSFFLHVLAYLLLKSFSLSLRSVPENESVLRAKLFSELTSARQNGEEQLQQSPFDVHSFPFCSLCCSWSTFAVWSLSMNVSLLDDAVWAFIYAMPSSGMWAHMFSF